MIKKPHKTVNSRYERQTSVCLFLSPEGVDAKTLGVILMKAGAEMVAESGKGCYCLHQPRGIFYESVYGMWEKGKKQPRKSLNRSIQLFI